MNKMIIMGGAALVLIGGGGGAYYKFMRKPAAVHQRLAKPAPTPAPKVAYVEVKEITLRLADTDVEHYMKITPVLAVRVAKADDLNEKMPIVRDRINAITSARTSVELATPAGQQKLKHDLLGALQGDFKDDVVDIYFDGYLVE
ncbi:MAG TPA: flagellar basal body-associated FliL family protein [Candidatus Binataceae bacterium]|nr:flagellar basal body-associated FliL family protein [Candidatus Binataceae bacterium]